MDLTDKSATVNPASGSAKTIAARGIPASGSLGGNTPVVYGGFTLLGPMDDLWIYEQGPEAWLSPKIPTSPPTSIYNAGAKIGDWLFVYGGFGNGLLGDLWRLSLKTGAWDHIVPNSKSPNPPALAEHSVNEWNSTLVLYGGFGDGVNHDVSSSLHYLVLTII